MRRLGRSLALAALLAPAAAPSPAQEEASAPPGAELLRALALRQDEREECLALALARAMTGDCEGGLAWLDAAAGAADDDLGRRLALERERLRAWMELRDAFLADLAASQKPLALELGGKKVSSPFTREGDELVLARGPVPRLSVRSLQPEALVAQIPKERFEGASEWLKIYPYCVTGNVKWRRLTIREAASKALARDAEELYPRLVALQPAVLALERLAERAAPADASAARAALAEVEALLALRGEACVRARLAALETLAKRLLVQVAEGLALGELVRASVTDAGAGGPRLVYDFTREDQAEDWRRDDGYLEDLRTPLAPVAGGDEEARFAPGPKGFAGSGAFCWRHAFEFRSPLRVRYQVRWDPTGSQPGKVFAFALGMLADEDERHLRANELGFLYVDELDGPYTAVRPKGDATVQLGRTYTIELVHDGRRVSVAVDGVVQAEADAERRSQGRVFLWGHSDLRITVPVIEIEGHPTPASLAAARAAWVAGRLAALGLASDK